MVVNLPLSGPYLTSDLCSLFNNINKNKNKKSNYIKTCGQRLSKIVQSKASTAQMNQTASLHQNIV